MRSRSMVTSRLPGSPACSRNINTRRVLRCLMASKSPVLEGKTELIELVGRSTVWAATGMEAGRKLGASRVYRLAMRALDQGSKGSEYSPRAPAWLDVSVAARETTLTAHRLSTRITPQCPHGK